MIKARSRVLEGSGMIRGRFADIFLFANRRPGPFGPDMHSGGHDRDESHCAVTAARVANLKIFESRKVPAMKYPRLVTCAACPDPAVGGPRRRPAPSRSRRELP